MYVYWELRSYIFVRDYVLMITDMKKDMYINGYASKYCITWDLKGLVTVYSSHCDHDTDRCYRPTVPVNPGHYRRLKSVNLGHWSTVR